MKAGSAMQCRSLWRWRQGDTCQGLWVNSRSQKTQGNIFFPKFSSKMWSWQHLKPRNICVSLVIFQNLRIINVCCYKGTKFVRAAIGNEYREQWALLRISNKVWIKEEIVGKRAFPRPLLGKQGGFGALSPQKSAQAEWWWQGEEPGECNLMDAQHLQGCWGSLERRRGLSRSTIRIPNSIKGRKESWVMMDRTPS